MHVAIALFDGFTALDAVGPYEVLCRVPGATVTFAAVEPGIIRTDTGVVGLAADTSFADVEGADVVVVPGGPGTRRMMTDEPLLDMVCRLGAAAQWTTSVCTGALVLGAAGLLRGRPATTHWATVDLLESLGATYVPDRVVVDGSIVTAAGVSAGIDMALVLAAKLAGDDVARAIQLSIEYDPQPPFDAGSVAKAGPEIEGLVRAAMATRQPELA